MPRQVLLFSGAAPHGACWFALIPHYHSKWLFLVFLHRLTRKRVDILYQTHLIIF